ncbi:hypothetical protein R3P38DRAFT_1062821 [Favolaschia claudopus]|uniref:BZIP domain-containing protein n=1 Tax=Favolaschia claudopus TaxID=2862362 RepID=A0AAW0BHC6_9AGAR
MEPNTNDMNMWTFSPNTDINMPSSFDSQNAEAYIDDESQFVTLPLPDSGSPVAPLTGSSSEASPYAPHNIPLPDDAAPFGHGYPHPQHAYVIPRRRRSHDRTPTAHAGGFHYTHNNDPNAMIHAHMDAAARRRRKNTLAARKTRQRKAEYILSLEETVRVLEGEVTVWRERALVARELLRARGFDFDFGSESEYDLGGHGHGHGGDAP